MGRNVEIKHGLEDTLEQIAPFGSDFADAVLDFYMSVPHQLRIPLTWSSPYEDASSLWVVHAAARVHRQGQADKGAFERSIYGYPLEGRDEKGDLMREDWASVYDGSDPVIHGHVVHREPSVKNRVTCLIQPVSMATSCPSSG